VKNLKEIPKLKFNAQPQDNLNLVLNDDVGNEILLWLC
jgi:hypothetical protein